MDGRNVSSYRRAMRYSAIAACIVAVLTFILLLASVTIMPEPEEGSPLFLLVYGTTVIGVGSFVVLCGSSWLLILAIQIIRPSSQRKNGTDMPPGVK
jgi:hypothetical protein